MNWLDDNGGELTHRGVFRLQVRGSQCFYNKIATLFFLISVGDSCTEGCRDSFCETWWLFTHESQCNHNTRCMHVLPFNTVAGQEWFIGSIELLPLPVCASYYYCFLTHFTNLAVFIFLPPTHHIEVFHELLFVVAINAAGLVTKVLRGNGEMHFHCDIT